MDRAGGEDAQTIRILHVTDIQTSGGGGPVLTIVFAGLLLFAGGSSLSGLAERMRFERVSAWVARGMSGLLGGLVGDQGGIRSATLLVKGAQGGS